MRLGTNLQRYLHTKHPLLDEVNEKEQIKALIGKTHPNIEIIESQDYSIDRNGYAAPGFLGGRPQIVIGIQNSHDDWMATISHELGHHLSGFSNRIFIARAAMKMVRPLWYFWRSMRKTILQREKDAWEAGFQYLTQHGFKISEAMLECRRTSLETYEFKAFREK